MLATLQMFESHQESAINSEESRINAFRGTLKLAKYSILEHNPGSLLDERDNILYCIIPLDRDYTDGGLRSWLDGLVWEVEQEQSIRMFAGISSICNDSEDYHRGFAEAEEAMQIGQHLGSDVRSVYFNDLGIYRYLYPFACSDNLQDPYLDQIAAIARYDKKRKRSELLNTLELYLEHDGNIKDTSELLAVHRNTLALRIQRIQSLCSSDVQLPGNRLALLAAIKVHRLRAIRS
jgi:sugar diacid utilization regulator